MAYIIENVDILKGNELENTSILIKNDRIQSLRSCFKRYHYMRMNAESFIMTPTHTIFDPEVPFNNSFQVVKEYFIDSFIKKGCTVLLTCAAVGKESLFKASLKEKQKTLLNSPIDYIIGIKIPIRLLTPSIMRLCKKERIPVIFVEVEDPSELCTVPWGWVREALFPYNSPLVPIIKDEKPKIRKQVLEKWIELLKNEKMPFIDNEIQAGMPISHWNLCKIGVYPLKSGIHQGAEISYNFYSKGESNNIDESNLILYHSHRLLVTVHKGTIIRAGDEVSFRPGFGEQVIIHTPSFYSES